MKKTYLLLFLALFLIGGLSYANVVGDDIEYKRLRQSCGQEVLSQASTFFTVTLPTVVGARVEEGDDFYAAAVNSGDDFQFTVLLDEGYEGSTIVAKVNGEVVTTCAENVYVIPEVLSDLMVTVELFGGETTYMITVTQGDNGVIAPESIMVSADSDQEFTITPNDGYVVKNVVVNGDITPPSSSYKFENVRSNHSLTATFERANGVNGLSESNGQIYSDGKNICVKATGMKNATVTIVDILGFIVTESQISDGGLKVEVEKGVYVVRIAFENGVVKTGKVIVK